MRRLPAVDRLVKDIGRDDKRVRIVGIVVDKGDEYIVVDDGTGKIELVVEGNVNVNIGDVVKVIVKCLSNENKYLCEAVQPANGLDIKLYREARKMLMEVVGRVQGGDK